MSKIVKITESQEQILLETLIMERTYPVSPEKVLLVKKYLDDNYERISKGQFNNDGNYISVPFVKLKAVPDENNVIDAKGLFYRLEREFKGMFSDKIQRSKFLVQIIKDWYAGKISKEGLLSTTHY